MTLSKLTLPATGEDVLTRKTGSDEHAQAVYLIRSDTLDAVTIDANGQKVYLGLAIPAGDNNIGNVDVVTLPALPAGTNAIGKLAANSGVDIGDVDVTSLPALPAGTNHVGTVGISDGTLDLSLLDLTTRPAVPVGLVNTAGDQQTLASDASITATGISLDTGDPYTAGDSADSTIWTFADAAASSGGSGWISKVLVQDKTGTEADFRIYFLNASVTPSTENDDFDLDDTEGAAIEQVVSTADGVWTSYGDGSVCIVNTAPLPYKLASGTSLFAVGEVLAAFAPAAADDISVKIYVVRN